MRPLIVVLPILLSGCAAAAAHAAVARGQRALSEAQATDRAERAVYERTLAEIYLVEARAQASLSSYRSSIDLARQAREWAERARDRAGAPTSEVP